MLPASIIMIAHMFMLLIFIFGLVLGSFLNVVILRLKANKSFLSGRSVCPHCQHQLTARDLVPLLSFLWQKGRCRYCQKKISWQYFVVELITGLCFVLIWQHHAGLEIILTTNVILLIARDFIFTSFLIIIFVYDLKYFLILDKVSLPLMLIALIFNLILGFSLVHLILAAVVAGGFFLLQYLVSRGQWIGGGDIRLGVVMGLILGWPNVILALFLAYIIGAIVAIFLLMSKKKKWHSEVPLGTFLSLATFLVLLYGNFLGQSYWQWFGSW